MSFSRRWVGLAALVAAFLLSWQAAGALDPDVAEVVIRPAWVPRPPLRYRLLPRLSDQAPGAAAPLYAQAFLALQERKVDDQTWNKMQTQWPNMPLEEFPKEEVAEALAQVDVALRCVEQAARRPTYGLDVPPEDYGQILPTLATQVPPFRTVARLILLRIRCRILEGDYEGALHWLQVGYAMARHCAEQPTTLNAFYAIALAGIMNHETKELIGSTSVPNLYWTIAALPEPIVDLQTVFDFESIVFESMFPEFGRAKAAGATPDQWRTLCEEVIYSPPWRQAAEGRPGGEKPDIDVLIKKGLPIARRNLLARGLSEAELDAMPPAEVAARALFEGHQTECEQFAKWCRLPYWQAKPGIEQQAADIRRLLEEAGLPWGGLPADLPTHAALVYRAAAEPQRYLAGLRCLEAVRLYAAEHDGKLPRRLDDITEVPVPVNPMTGQPFPYRAEERYVILDLDGSLVNYQWWIRLAD